MNRPQVVWAGLALWLFCFCAAFVAFSMTEPTGDSFLRGINRVGVFVTWQLIGAVPATVAFVASRHIAPGWGRRLTWVPVGLYASVIVLVLALIVWSRVQSFFYTPSVPTTPPTTVAPDAQPVVPRD